MAINVMAHSIRSPSTPPRCTERQTVARRILLIFLLSIMLASLLLLPWMNSDIREQGEKAIQVIELFIQDTARQLKPLIQSEGEADCSTAAVTHLRRQVFGFRRVKEIGLYNPDFNVYCVSNDGAVRISLPSGLRERLENTRNGQVLWLTRAKVSDTPALFIYLRNATGMGANVLMSPTAVTEVVGQALQGSRLSYQLDVLGQKTGDPRLGPPGLFETEQVFQSLEYPITLTLQQTRQSQLSFGLQHLWVGLLLGSFTALLYLFHVYIFQRRNEIRAALQRALVLHELHICYQPIMDFQRNRPVGFETMLRWQHPYLGSMSPDVVMSLAEQLGMIAPVTEYVLDQATVFITEHPEELVGCYISVNISRYYLLHYDVAGMIEQRCQQLPALSRYLILELAQDCAFADSELVRVSGQLKQLQACGIRLAVDECGSGCSGLTFIQSYPFDLLKLDRAFIKRLGEDRAAMPLLESVVWRAERRGATVIAEGVELAEQATQLAQLGVVLMQGLLFARPVPRAQLLEWLALLESQESSPLLFAQACEPAQAHNAQNWTGEQQPE